MQEKSRSTTLADSVENSLLQYIKNCHLNPGDPLPKEEYLTEQFKVSRPSVREGISRLRALGVVECRKKRGTVLRSPDPFGGLRKLTLFHMFTENQQRDFMELRVALELGMCPMIYARKTPDDLSRLREVASLSDAYVPPLSVELDFHSIMMEISGNQVAGEFRELLSSAFSGGYLDVLEKGRTLRHSEICDALEKGSCQDFYDAVYQHFAPYLDALHPLRK